MMDPQFPKALVVWSCYFTNYWMILFCHASLGMYLYVKWLVYNNFAAKEYQIFIESKIDNELLIS